MTRAIVNIKVRQGKCKICGSAFSKRNTMHKVCSPMCAKILAEKIRQKELTRELRAGRERLKSTADHAKDAQKACNEFVRYIDRDDGCVTCGTMQAGQWDAGHYRTTRAAPALRFHLWNVWKQCSVCNSHKSGDILRYRISLTRRIGEKAVEWIESVHETPRLRSEDYMAIKQHFRDLLRYAKANNLSRRDFVSTEK